MCPTCVFEPRAQFIMKIGQMMIQTLKFLLGPPLILAAALVVGPCQVNLAQGDADLEAPGLEPFPTPVGNGATLFQNVRIFDGRSPALGALGCAG